MIYSIVLCTYNGAPFISKQIESYLEQAILPKKIIISDDGSSDNTVFIIKEIFNKLNYTDYLIISGPKRGVIHNFLSALKYADSDYIFLSDQDDIWHKDKISEFAKIAKQADKPNLVFSDATLIDENANEIAPSFFQYQGLTVKCLDDDSILFRNCVQGAACAINKPLRDLVIQSLEIIDINKLYMHDWWIALLAKYYGSYQFINRPLIEYRQHTKNQVGAFNHKFRFLFYVTKLKHYCSNFGKAIKQVQELEYFTANYKKMNTRLVSRKYRVYNYVSKLKVIVIRLLKI